MFLLTCTTKITNNDGKKKLKFDWFILHRVQNVAGEALEKLWILFLVNGTKDCRLHPAAGIDDRTVRDFAREIVAGELFAVFQRSNECLAEKNDRQIDADALSLICGL